MLRMLLADDDPVFLSKLERLLTQYAAQQQRKVWIDAYPRDDLSGFVLQSYDIAFLDIQMENVDGLTLAKELRQRNRKTALFFITNYEGYQDNAMDLQALRYFKKPFEPERLIAGLDKALEYIDGAYVDVFLYSGGVQQRVLVDEILYLTLDGRKVAIQTVKSRFLVTGKLEEWMERFPHTFFRQPHKSFLVNLHYVERYAYSELQMSDGTRIPIAPKKQPEFRRIWFEYIGR